VLVSKNGQRTMIKIRSKKSLNRLKDIEGTSFKRGGNSYTVICVDIFNPDEMFGVPPYWNKTFFPGVVYRNNHTGSVHLTTVGPKLIGEPIKEVSGSQINLLKNSKYNNDQMLAKMSVTDPVSFIKLF
jgi:hypothetical protein